MFTCQQIHTFSVHQNSSIKITQAVIKQIVSTKVLSIEITLIPPLTSSAHTIDYSPIRMCDLLKGYIHSLKNSLTQALICLFFKNSCKYIYRYIHFSIIFQFHFFHPQIIIITHFFILNRLKLFISRCVKKQIQYKERQKFVKD